MKFEWKNIFRILKIMLIIVGVVFFLSACDKQDNADKGEDSTMQTSKASAANITCFQGAIIGILYDAGGTAAMGAYDGLTSGAMTASMIGFAMWFALEMLKYLSSFTEQNAAQEWTKVGRQFFMCLVCGFFAQSTGAALWTLNTFIFPLYFSFLELGVAVLNLKSGESGTITQCVAGEALTFQAMTCSASLGDVSEGGFPSGPKEMMGCMICSINSRLSLGYALSTKLMSGGLMNWLSGLILAFVFIVIKVSFVFYLIDTVFRMTLMIVLFPLLTIAYAFQVTRRWSIEALKILLNCSALACFIGIILAMVLLAIQKVIEIYQGIGVGADADADTGPQVIVVLLLAFLVKSSLDVAKSITDGLVGGGTEANFASQGAKILAWVAMRIASAISDGVTDPIEKALEKYEFIKKIRNMKKKIQKLANRAGMQAPSKPKGGG